MGEYLWWRDGVIYQIYPRSFLDTNGDGIGDLPGITSRLDYLADLGVAALWLSPIYPSPDADFGYDVADHTAVDARYGTLADFDNLVEQAHRRGLRIILDAVLNHTSDKHPWFLESRSSRDNPRRDWYTWRPPSGSPHFFQKWGERKRGAPNNWVSAFGGRAWEYDPGTGEYYYHMYARQQPDLNFNNPQVCQAQLDVLRFWLERGVDGFRLDVFNACFEHPDLPDNPGWFAGLTGIPLQKHLNDADQPALVPFLRELRALLDRYPGRYAVGETFGNEETAARYVGDDLLHAAFSFDFTSSRWSFPFNPRYFMRKAMRRESLFSDTRWPTNVFSNHDLPRAATRYAHGEDDAPARLAMALLLTLRGTPFMYQGEEIGMRDISLRRAEILDPPGRRFWPLYKGRDGCRAPFQWSASPNAGFTAGRPWLKVHPDYPVRNLAAQQADPGSFFYFTHRLIALRQIHPALQRGDFVPLAATGEAVSPDLPGKSRAPGPPVPAPQVQANGVLAYQRSISSETLTILLNFTRKPTPLRLPPNAPHSGGEKEVGRELCVLFSTDRAEGVITGPIVLAPQEVCIIGWAGDR